MFSILRNKQNFIRIPLHLIFICPWPFRFSNIHQNHIHHTNPYAVPSITVITLKWEWLSDIYKYVYNRALAMPFYTHVLRGKCSGVQVFWSWESNTGIFRSLPFPPISVGDMKTSVHSFQSQNVNNVNLTRGGPPPPGRDKKVFILFNLPWVEPGVQGPS